VRDWDLRREYAVRSVGVFGNKGPVVTELAGFARSRPDLCAFGGSDGTVGWIDWREPASSSSSGTAFILGRHQYSIVSLSTCPAGLEGVGGDVRELVVSADLGGEVYIWDLRTNANPVAAIRAHSGSLLTAMTTHPTSEIIVTAGTDHFVKTFGPKNQTTEIVHRAGDRLRAKREPPITALAFHPDAHLLAVGCADSTVMFYERH
jgi:WD40 repeat protein